MLNILDDKILNFLFNDKCELTCLEAAVIKNNKSFLDYYLKIVDGDELFKK